jgi:hypothetical protein
MIVNHACRLHERVADCGTDELESASQQIAAHRVGFGSARGYVSQDSPTILNWRAAYETPEISVETSEFVFNREKVFRIPDSGCDFQPVSHNPIVA